MKCNNKNIKEFLPAYREEALDPEARGQVEAHLKTCEDCGRDLALLRTMAEDPVPDPGEAFWATMPDRIYRDVQREQSRKRDRRGMVLRDILEKLRVQRLALAAAVVVLVGAVSWIMVRSAPEYSPRAATTAQDRMSAEEILDPVDVAGLDSGELEGIASWVDTALADIGDQTEHFAMNSMDTNIYDDLVELNAQEIEQFSTLMETEEPEA